MTPILNPLKGTVVLLATGAALSLSSCAVQTAAKRDNLNVMEVSVPLQKMALYKEGQLVKTYLVSTSKFGLGDEKGSYRTPTGKMEVAEKIGSGKPAGAVFKSRQWTGEVIMRLADVIMSFPSLLLAVIVLYMLEPSIANLVLVLAITRIPIYLRTTRAKVLEVRERMFVQAARVMGASNLRIIFRHILPVILPTLLTIATLDFAFVMLAESALSFLGIGIQAPEVTWGLMVSQGRQYLTNAWWLAFWPGLAIILTTMSLNLLSSWMRVALNPTQRWRLEIGGKKNG